VLPVAIGLGRQARLDEKSAFGLRPRGLRWSRFLVGIVQQIVAIILKLPINGSF